MISHVHLTSDSHVHLRLGKEGHNKVYIATLCNLTEEHRSLSRLKGTIVLKCTLCKVLWQLGLTSYWQSQLMVAPCSTIINLQ